MNDELMQAQMDAKFAADMGRATQRVVSVPVSAPADFHSLLGRIRQASAEANEARFHAGTIADAIHGCQVDCSNECARDHRAGLIGQYEDAIDELMIALSETRSNLRRISNGIPDVSKGTLA